ncbi:MAG: methyltransferase [Bacteroidia bacterium]|jgi:SAM-dependent methyltransferase
MDNLNLNRDFWEDRYRTQQIGWDIGYPTPALVNYFNTIADKQSRILIPGCGNAYEAQSLLESGFTHITLIDIAPTAVQHIREKYAAAISNNSLQVIGADFFDHEAQYDLIIEQTFFCALDPKLRQAYARKMHDLLKPGGKLAGLLFNFPLTEEGPPFGGSEAEYRELFESLFTLTIDPTPDSIPPRAGRELFFEAVKR